MMIGNGLARLGRAFFLSSLFRCELIVYTWAQSKAWKHILSLRVKSW